MSLDARLDKIPNFVTARSPLGLRRVMLMNNIKNSVQFVYHDIQFVNGVWYAWYYQQTKVSEIADGDTNRPG